MSVGVVYVQVASEDLRSALGDPARIEGLVDSGRNRFDPGDLWDALAYLLHPVRRYYGPTVWGENPRSPLGQGLAGAKPLAGTDMGVGGPGRYLSLTQVKAVSEALAGIDSGEMQAVWDLDSMQQAKVYRVDVLRENRKSLAEALRSFEELRAFYASAARDGRCVVTHFA